MQCVLAIILHDAWSNLDHEVLAFEGFQSFYHGPSSVFSFPYRSHPFLLLSPLMLYCMELLRLWDMRLPHMPRSPHYMADPCLSPYHPVMETRPCLVLRNLWMAKRSWACSSHSWLFLLPIKRFTLNAPVEFLVTLLCKKQKSASKALMLCYAAITRELLLLLLCMLGHLIISHHSWEGKMSTDCKSTNHLWKGT